ncbi:tetratricopeptide repeat protein [Reichenbachiella versicolor]|uniref:tetratricopeptide repeat protein n=1 Tax=Reichenbachiella versicolor TaxID=1821036 RepID=UPI000D6E1AE7|nr:tetratricopeptide repeat protein [Reichenbachiella versicolor]
MKKFLVILLCCSFSFNSYSQEWYDLYNQGTQMYDNYNLEKSKELSEQALGLLIAEKGNNNANVAAVLRQLVITCYEGDWLEEGIKYGSQELLVLEAIGNKDKLVYGTALYNLGLIFSVSEDYLKAKELLNQSLILYEVYHELGSPEIAEVQGSLASVMYYSGDKEQSELLFEKAIAILNQQDETSPEFFNIVYAYSELLIDLSKYDQAIESLLDLTEFYDDNSADKNYGSLLLKLGSTFEFNNDLVNAKKYYEESNRIFDLVQAPNESDNLNALSALTTVLLNEGAIEEALSKMKLLVDARSSKKDDAYYNSLVNLGKIYFRSFQFDKAEESFQIVLEEQESANSESYFNALSGMTLVDLEKGQFKKAAEESKKGLNAISEASQIKVDLLISYANANTALGRYKISQLALEEALGLVETNEKELEIKLGLVSLYTTTQNFDKAESLFKKLNKIYSKKKEQAPLQYASYLGVYANYLQYTSQYLSAENVLNESLEIKKKLLSVQNENYLSTYSTLGQLNLTKGKYDKAKSIFSKVLATKKTIPQITKYSLAYTNEKLGIVTKYLGEYADAESYFMEAMKLYGEEFGKAHVYYAGGSNELGLLYMKMGNLKAAAPLFQSALYIYEKAHGRNHVDYASVLENQAALFSLQGNYEKSRASLEQVLEIDKVLLGTEHPLYAKTLHNLAATLEETGEYEKASRFYEKSIRIYAKHFGDEHPSYATTLYNIAVLEQEIGNYEGAKVHYQQVIDIRKKVLNENHPDLAYSIYGKASVEQKLGDYEAARKDYQYAIESYMHSIQNYFPSLSEAEKSAFYGKIKPVFEAYQDFAIEYVSESRGDESSRDEILSTLYNLQLSTKALLLNATNKVRNRILNSGNDVLIAKYNEWKSIKEDLVKGLNMSQADLFANKIDLVALQQKSNQMEKELSKLSEGFANEFEKNIVQWTDVKSALVTGEGAMEIIRVKKNIKNDSVYYAALIVTPASESSPKLVIVKDGLNMETKFFKQYKNLIVFKMDNLRSFDQFWSAIDKEIEDIDNLYVSADGVYNKINVNTLFDPRKKEYVFDKYSIYLLSNTRELVENKEEIKARQTRNHATVFGYPDYEMGGISDVTIAAVSRGFENGVSELPGTLVEINNITNTLSRGGWEYDRHDRSDANEENVKKIDNPKLLHIATHGFFMSDINLGDNENIGLQSREAKYNPLFRSGLLLAGAGKTFRGEKLDGGEDGILTAYEAMNLNLDDTELVVMSACETGLGEIRNGEGVYGLQRSFIVAGADNLIMSLWKVNDETTQMLMSNFYKNWVGGKTKQEAFHDSIQILKKKFKQPYYWGAFVMLGH